MANPVMVATDLSARDDRAVDRALMLARQWGTRTGVIHVPQSGVGNDTPVDWNAKVRAVLPDPQADVDIILPEGSAPTAIVDAARERDGAVIVTGIARMNDFCDYFLGTTVDHVLRHTDLPVLVVKQRPHADYARIMVATDFSQGSRVALTKAADLFPNIPIDLVHAFHVPYESRFTSDDVRADVTAEESEDMDSFVAQEAISDALRKRIATHVIEGDTNVAIARAIERLQPDLFVVGTHGKSGFRRATIGSKAEALIKWVPVDTFAVRSGG